MLSLLMSLCWIFFDGSFVSYFKVEQLESLSADNHDAQSLMVKPFIERKKWIQGSTAPKMPEIMKKFHLFTLIHLLSVVISINHQYKHTFESKLTLHDHIAFFKKLTYQNWGESSLEVILWMAKPSHQFERILCQCLHVNIFIFFPILTHIIINSSLDTNWI